MLQVRERRLEAGMTQAALAYAAGVSERTVRRAEELGSATSTTVAKLAGALEISISDLFVSEEGAA